jgi:hypothetical protein
MEELIKVHTICIMCSTNAYSLVTPAGSQQWIELCWCAVGHVTINGSNVKPKIIHDFSVEKA